MNSIKDYIVYEKTVEGKEASYVEYPSSLNTEIKNYLKEQQIPSLYCHQGEMFERAKKGEHVVITTATASGKTLSFLLPVLQEILEHPQTRAIFLYPTKALASDQYRALLPLLDYFGEHRISAGVYDGDTPPKERTRIRQQANIILTNPEMLNGSFLPNHSKYGFDFIFANLKYVVIDELHTYRGAFGSHLGNVFRRLSRICKYYGSTTQFLCSSATIANPVELAQEICGVPFSLVSKDGAPVGVRRYILIQPPKIMGKDKKYYGQVQAATIAAELLPSMMNNNENFIAFAKSRKGVEVVLKEVRDKITAAGFLSTSTPEQISGYRGGYTPIERKEIEQKMISGELKGLVSTNALELGIDIGSVQATVLIGYPGTRASFWQQTGRAGRGKKESTNYMILDYLPFDQYIALCPEWLFDNTSEQAVVDKDNLLIELAHIRAAAAEIPLTLDDIALFPDLGETIPVLLKAEELTSQGGRFAWNGGDYPAGDFSMRNIDENRYKLLQKEDHTEITQMDESQAFHEIHQGAIYLHDGTSYQVLNLDLDSKTAYAIPFDGNYYTVPGGEVNVKVIHKMNEKMEARIQMSFGDVNVSEYVYMYKKLQFHNHQNLGFEKLPQPLTKDFDTESTWLKLPENLVQVYRQYLQPSPNGLGVRNNHFEGLCFAIKNAAMMQTMTEKEDIGVITSNEAMELAGQSSSEAYLYIYDKYVGGLGFSEKIYDCMSAIIDNAIHMVADCPCQDGCAACVGDYKLDKQLVLWGLKSLKEELAPPEGMKEVTFAPVSFEKKPYFFSELPEKWTAFCTFVKEKGDFLGAFLETVPSVEIEGNRMILVLTNDFYAQWTLEPENQKSIRNVISYYTDAPLNLLIDIRLEQQTNHGNEKQEKIQRRFHTFKES